MKLRFLKRRIVNKNHRKCDCSGGTVIALALIGTLGFLSYQVLKPISKVKKDSDE